MKADKRSTKLPGSRQRKTQVQKSVHKKSTRQINRSENGHDYQEEDENETTIAPAPKDHRVLPPSPPSVQVPKHLLRSDPKQPVEDLSLPPSAPETITSEPEHPLPVSSESEVLPCLVSSSSLSSTPAVASKNDAVIYPQIKYAKKPGKTLIYTTVLDEMWEVHWEQFVQVKWNHNWSQMHCEAQMIVKDTRHDESGSMLWIHGDFMLIGVGTTTSDSILRHETVHLPFSSMVLRPATTSVKSTPASSMNLPPIPIEKWVQTGDWRVDWLAKPFHQDDAASHEEGIIQIQGRVWWFQKQLFPIYASIPISPADEA
ncbi:hypothetical protein EDM59_00595 [Brevibacillus nitrificans]|uniref:Uncharacterized protein n=1 Tax=Brevibacillus nitrificans TaxID=651560 RepID=A0A3M8DVA5_9BACL|nr:hypothetical protein [Brevibacillus nitrificans]RNB90917.1 hypothetical protein EDM59_00595 [Brevibacillus nitrificans]